MLKGASALVTVNNDKVYINGVEFLIKGIDYAPWLIGTGPEPAHSPFPGENDDVTSKVNSVPDYNRDGKIETWEVIEYDLSVMKSVGANTIRTYAAGVWHDRDLDGVNESNEFVKGDVPDWAHRRIINFAERNNMKVIIGYWVQEEDFKPGLECNFDDLKVSKDTMTRVVNNFGNSPALIGWAIGNEVSLDKNHEWFTWTVPINDYLNQLYTHVRTVDQNRRPIIYSKYINEGLNFSNLNAEIMAINSYTFPAEKLGNEFTIPATGSRAYILGELGHLIEHAPGHWALSKQHAGGAFLEYNDVWWKGSGSYFGIVNVDRSLSYDRYEVLRNLFNGSGVILIISPQNTSYFKTYVPLNFTIDRTASWIGYSLDNQPNITITGNKNLTGLSNGAHNIIVYFTDSTGKTGSSDKIYFFYCLGDINGDKKIDMKDIGNCSKLFGLKIGLPNWDSKCDLNDDGKIDMKDIGTLSKQFGKVC